MRNIRYAAIFLLLISSTVLAEEPPSLGCKPWYKTMPKDVLDNLLGTLYKVQTTGEETFHSNNAYLKVVRKDNCTISFDYYEQSVSSLPTCSELVVLCTGKTLSQEELEALIQKPSKPLTEFHGDFPGDTFQDNKARRVKESMEKNKGTPPPEDQDTHGDTVELLVTLIDGADEDSVLTSIKNGKGEVVQKGYRYLPNIIKVKVQKTDEEAFFKNLGRNPNVERIEKNIRFKLQGKMHPAENILTDNAKDKEKLPPEDQDTPGDSVELLVTLIDGADEDSVLTAIKDGKGEVLKKGNPYLPNIIRIKVLKADKGAFWEKLEKNPNVKRVEKVGHFKLQGKMHATESIIGNNAKDKEELLPEDQDTPGDSVELLVTLIDGADEDSVLTDIKNGKGEVVKKGYEYLPNAIKIKVLKVDKDTIVDKLKKNPNVKTIEKVGYLKLQGKMNPTENILVDNAKGERISTR